MSQVKLIIIGRASHKILLSKELFQEQEESSLMSYLHHHNIPIASSCSGEGICKKCIIKNSEAHNILSCQILMEHIKAQDTVFYVDYL